MTVSADKAKELLNNAAPSFAKFKEKSQDDGARWQKEIDLLQNRVNEAVAEVELGNGHTISIRLCLLDSEAKRLVELEQANLTETDPQKAIENTCETIAIVTANPLITKEWLMENPDKYSPTDLLSIVLGFMEVRSDLQRKRMEQIRSAAAFRTIGVGAELR